jgi:predicted nuclease of predicted toxin-antitoxin system
MKIKLDENLPAGLVTTLDGLGHDVHTTHQEGLVGQADIAVWEAAQRESRFLITQDLDFSDLRKFAPGSHCGVLLVRLHSPDRQSLLTRISELFRAENTSDWTGSFVVATERKVRVVKPQQK